MAPISNDWLEPLKPEFRKPYYAKLYKTVMDEYHTKRIYPPADDIFNAFALTPLKDVKVVILGQDPYHGDGQAHGLCFSVKPEVEIPPSLVNIYKELHDDLGCTIPNHGCLTKWAEQGVLMLNTVLTVRAHQANSHRGIGWGEFTDAAIKILNEQDRPMVFIAEAGDIVGTRIGVKTDWYCLCLDADAHHFNKEHPIFHGPFEVNISVELKPTPSEAFRFVRTDGQPLPDSLEMWRVQTKGYKTEEGFRPGMIARPWGFADSPDAEYISGGVSAKDIDAVAMGRHGNFFFWGFSASPENMTDEAQTVFANAVAYISKFAGQTPIARRYKSDIATREYAVQQKDFISYKRWQERMVVEKQYIEKTEEIKKVALAKQAKGEKLTSEEKAALRSTVKLQSYAEWLKSREPVLFEKFGDNEQAYKDYFDDNRDYFYGGDKVIYWMVDEDVKSWGIPNNDIRLLDKAIGCWERGEEVDKAKRVLTRYTLCRFATPQEWRDWYETNKDRIFFTESGGWFFMVNTRDLSVPGNDYRMRGQKIPGEDYRGEKRRVPETEAALTSDKNPVYMEMKTEEAENGNKWVVVKMNIHPGYHTYARVASTDPYMPTALQFTFPEGWGEAEKLLWPVSKKLNEAGTRYYEGEVVFRQEIKGKGKGEVHCTVEYQCCNDYICMPPGKVELNVRIE